MSSLEAQLQNVNLSQIIDRMHHSKSEIIIPKFKVESEFHMNDILKKVCGKPRKKKRKTQLMNNEICC